MALKQKTPRFKDIGSGEMNTGGAPIFADDFITIQENGRADFINSMEYYRRRLPLVQYYQGPGNPLAPEHEAGLILSGCEYDNTDPQNPVISEGFIYSEGEVCYYPGGTFNTGPTAPGLIYLYKGPESPISRTFNDGGSKEILTSFTCVAERGSIGATGPTLPGVTGIVSTTQAVVISCGTLTSTTSGYAETFCTIDAALKLSEMGARLNKNGYSNAVNFNTGMTLPVTDMPFMVSRILTGNYTEIRGAVTVDLSAMVGAEVRLFDLAAHAINTGYRVPLFVGLDFETFERPSVYVNNAGEVYLVRPFSGSWYPSTVTLIFNSVVYGRNTPPVDDYTYNKTFLDIT